MSRKLIAVVDDEQDILELVSINLEKSQFKVKTFDSATKLLDFLEKKIPDLIVLDLMLPDIDGIDVCKYLKKQKKYSSIPIIMLTAKADEIDKIIGLELGADDYITKPFSPKELVARVKVVLRRSVPDEENIITIAEILEIDLYKYTASVAGNEILLTPTEFKILSLLSKRKGWVFSREKILDYLDISDKGVLDRTVDVHIKNLRDKLGPAGKLIKNIRTIGYKIDD